MMMDFWWRAVVIGAGATLAIDLWSLLLRQVFGWPMANWGLVGRWVMHALRGQFVHADIGMAEPVAQEHAIGWAFHYAVGILFAAITLLIGGPSWVAAPTWPLPLIVGLVTVGCGWFILLPGMGAGMAAAKKPERARIRVLGLVAHTIFGFAMYGLALLIRP
ncbi:MAG: DUF2938 domain-containing protein [Beijerinckiaceae bacterium]